MQGGTQRVTKRFIAALLALTLLAVAGCSKGSDTGGGNTNTDPGKPVEGGTLNLSMFSAPKGMFNPILSESLYDSNVDGLVYSGLLETDEKLQWICDLCESFAISSDNKTVTFKLKKHVKFHDGKPLTTADVAFTFRAMLHPEYTGVRTGDFTALVGAQKMIDERDALDQQVEDKKITGDEARKKKLDTWQAWLNGDGKQAINVIDEFTIAFTTDEPYAPLLGNLGYGILPAHLLKDADMAKLKENPFNGKPVGTGPFKFAEYKTDQFVKLDRYDGYHKRKPYIQTIIYKIVNQDVAIGQLKSGELDYIEMNPTDADLVKGDKGIQLHERADFGYQYMGLNHDNPLFKEAKVRQALMYGINRKAIVDQLLLGHGTVMNSHMPPALWAYDEKSLNAYPYDTKKAADLLAEAGWKDKNAEGYLTKGGKVFEFTLRYPSGNKTREQSAPLIQANLKAIGVKVNLQMMEFATLAEVVFDKRDMDAWLMGWSLSLDPDPGALFLPDNTWGKVTGWTNARNEQLIKTGTKVLKVEERKPIYVEWAKILNDELPYIFLYSKNNIDAMRTDKVRGVKPDARGMLWNIHEIWIKG